MYEPEPDIVQLKEVLQKNKCHEHLIKPAISVFDSTMIIRCCCPAFRKKCILLAEDLNESLGIKNLVFL